ncbi:MAG: 2-hydroxyacyl-CoA dehydratase family protein [Bacillota bacterium]
MKWQNIQAAATGEQLPQSDRQLEFFRQMLEREEERTRLEQEKMAWLCSYTPVEIIAACNLVPYRLLAADKETLRADIYLHPTLCSYVRGALENALSVDGTTLQGAVLLNSCNAASHLYHSLSTFYSQKFHYFMDLPHDASPAALDFWAGELRQFHRALARYRGIALRVDTLQEQIVLYHENRKRMAELYGERKGEVAVNGNDLIRLVQASMLLPASRFREILGLFANHAQKQQEKGHFCRGPRLFLLGSVLSKVTIDIIEEQGGVLILDDLCMGRRAVTFDAIPAAGEDPYYYLARLYLGRYPCPRMKGSFAALDELEQLLRDYRIDGVILYYLKFCDAWYYLGQILKERIRHIPVLILEGEYTGMGGGGQLRTRIAAFLEMLSQKNSMSAGEACLAPTVGNRDVGIFRTLDFRL